MKIKGDLMSKLDKLLCKAQWHLHNIGLINLGNLVQDIRDKIKKD